MSERGVLAFAQSAMVIALTRTLACYRLLGQYYGCVMAMGASPESGFDFGALAAVSEADARYAVYDDDVMTQPIILSAWRIDASAAAGEEARAVVLVRLSFKYWRHLMPVHHDRRAGAGAGVVLPA